VSGPNPLTDLIRDQIRKSGPVLIRLVHGASALPPDSWILFERAHSNRASR